MKTSTYNLPCLFVLILFMLVVSPVTGRDSDTHMPGTIRCYLFMKGSGMPVADIQAEIRGIEGRTDHQGLVTFSLTPGKHVLVLCRHDRELARISVPVASGETTEIIVTLDTDRGHDGPDVIIEAAELTDTISSIEYQEQSWGVLSCKVLEVEEKIGIADARIFFRGLDLETRTDRDGRFSVELPAGSHTLSVIHPDYVTQTLDNIVVTEGKNIELTIKLTPSSFELEEFTVKAIRIEGGVSELIEERRMSTNVSDIIGAEQISKSGDSDAAEALKRVTGLTVVGGKYVYIRGMGERYSSSVFNNASIPSPEPERRVVPLDLFPVHVIDSIDIQKTYSPDMPGEFGGGSVKIRTRAIPSGFVLNVSQSTGYGESTTGETGFTYDGGDLDWLGFDDGTRQLPSIVDRADHIHPWSPNGGGYQDDELDAFGKSFSNTWDVDKFTVPSNLGFSTTIGNRYDMGENNNAGYLLAFTYSDEYDITTSEYSNYGIANGELLVNDSFDFNVTTREIDLGGILDLGFERGSEHSVKLTSMILRVSEDRAQQYEGLAGDQGDYIKVTSLRWIEQMLWVEQLSGNHFLPFLFSSDINWTYTWSMVTRDEPDRRDVKYEWDDNLGAYRLSTLSDGNHRIFSELEGQAHDFHLKMATPYTVWHELEAKLKTGFNAMFKDRVVDTRRFYYNRGSNIDSVVLQLPPEEIFDPDNIGEGYMEFRESTLNTDHYEAEQLLLGFYLMTDLPLTERLDVSGGFRVEMSEKTVLTYNIFSTTEDTVIAKLETTDILPAVTFTWRMTDFQQLRLGYSTTVSRPDFRELSPATYNDVVGGREIKGNPDVKRALINNYDIRWEWYPTMLENVSSGLFYKDFIDPIEHTIDGGTNQQQSYTNATGAINYGVELEFRKNLGFLADPLYDLYLAGNLAFIKSEVNLDKDAGDETSKNRPLQGQSPYVINVTIGYDNPDTKTSLALLYNSFGERIVNAGYSGLPDVYEQPFQRLDLVFSLNLFGNMGLKFEANNLLDQRVEYTQQDQITEAYYKGSSYSLSLSWSY